MNSLAKVPQKNYLIPLLERSLEWACLFCGVLLVLIWPLSGTIAARNIALVLGCFSSLAWIYIARPKIHFQIALPILCLLAVPAWLWIHYFFLPTDTVAMLYDLKGTWVRVILAIIMASGLGLMISRRPKKIIWIWLAMTVLAMTTLGRFFWEVWQTNQWVINDFHFPFKYKSALVYFLMFPCLLAYALLHYCLLARDATMKGGLRTLILGFVAAVLAAICWTDFIAAHALNGVLAAAFMGALLLLIYLMHSFLISRGKRLTHWLLLAMTLFVIVSSITLFWRYDQKYEQKLGNLLGDVHIAVQIDKYPEWQRDSNFSGPRNPVDEKGRIVNESTYERGASFVKGIEILAEHPLGAGFSQLAFRYFMLQENPNFGLYKTHSGWLDYALGLGLPGLLLTWLAMVLVIYQSRKIVSCRVFNTPIVFSSLWILGGIWVLWWPTEVSEREFIEYLFFIIALLGSTNDPKGLYPSKHHEVVS